MTQVSFSSVTADSIFQVIVSVLVFRKKWRKRVRRSIAAVTLVSIFICLDSLVTVVETGDSGVGVAVQVCIAELLVLFFGVFLYGGVGGKFVFDGAEGFSGGCGCEYLVQGLFYTVGDGFAGGIVEF